MRNMTPDDMARMQQQASAAMGGGGMGMGMGAGPAAMLAGAGGGGGGGPGGMSPAMTQAAAEMMRTMKPEDVKAMQVGPRG